MKQKYFFLIVLSWLSLLAAEAQVIATTTTNEPLIKVARAKGWISSTATQMTAAQAAQVTTIDSAFKDNKTIISFVEFEYFTKVTALIANAFTGCSNLTTITLPKSLSTYHDYAFDGATSLTAILVNSGNSYFTSVDGVLYNKAKTTICRYPIGKEAKSFTLPSTVTTVRNSCFYNSKIEEVTIPASVTSIETWAFRSSSIKTVNVNWSTPSSFSSIYVFGDYAMESGTLNVPAGTLSKYLSTLGWSFFSNIIERGTSNAITSASIGYNASTNENLAPYSNYYKYSTVQMLYTPAEIGKSGKINSIAFKVAAINELATSEVKVYLGHKSGKFSSTNDYVRSGNLTLVYSGSPTLGQNLGWERLIFNKNEFTYNGTDNLVVVVTKKCANYEKDLKYYYQTGSGYTLYRRGDGTEDFGDVTNTSQVYSTTDNRPTIKISFGSSTSQPETSTTVTIGENITSYYYHVPYNTLFNCSITQMLYTPSEIGNRCKIKSIAFKVAQASTLSTYELKVYLGHKSGKFSSENDYVRSGNLTLVYSGALTLGQALGWEKLQFNQGDFTYNGTDNLVVVVVRKSTNYNSSLKYYSNETSGYSLYYVSDDYPNTVDVTYTSYYSEAGRRPSIRFEVETTSSIISVDTDFAYNGVNYTLHPNGTATVKSVTVSGLEVVIPSSVNYQGESFNVTEIGASAFSKPNYSVTLPSSITTVNVNAFNNSRVLSVIWNGSASLTESHISKMKTLSQNVLIYVGSISQLQTSSLQNLANVVVNTTAQKVDLKDGYDFYCAKQFTANSISYKRNFQMMSGINGNSAGWETIALPFNVGTIRHSTKGELTAFANYSTTGTKKPFWLYSWSSTGWKKAGSIANNTPYLICFPNNSIYQADYILGGEITFSATYATVFKSSIITTGYTSASYDSRQFYPSFDAKEKSSFIYNINAGTTSSETGGETPGSAFIKNLRDVKPFEGYMYSTSATRPMYAVNPFGDDDATDIIEMNLRDADQKGEVRIYDTRGQLLVRTQSDNIDQTLRQLPEGMYIVNGKKVIVRR